MEIQKNFPLKKINTFGIDVNAKYFVNVESEDQLRGIFSDSKYSNLHRLILGGGSNILLTRDFSGLVIKVSIPGIKILEENEKSVFIEAGAGVVWHDLVSFSVKRNLGGIENLSLIPGTVGAAPIQNIGAYGQELKDSFYSLSAFNIKNHSTIEMNSAECKFGYRYSIFKNELREKFIITKVTLKLQKNPVLNIEYGNLNEELKKSGKESFSVKDVSDVICKIRQSKLPDPNFIGNAGSFFKNPEIPNPRFKILNEKFSGIIGHEIPGNKTKIAAAWLIEQCGWKGKRFGDAGVYEKQALVLVNYSNAKGEEIFKLAEEIKESVQEKFGIFLQEEVRII